MINSAERKKKSRKDYRRLKEDKEEKLDQRMGANVWKPTSTSKNMRS